MPAPCRSLSACPRSASACSRPEGVGASGAAQRDRVSVPAPFGLCSCGMRGRGPTVPEVEGGPVAPRDLSEGVERDIKRLYRDSAPQLWRAIYGFAGGRRHLAEDAVAEAFARAIERAREIRDPLAWIYRTAFRIASRELQRERRGPPALPDPPGHRPGRRAGRPLGAVDLVAEPTGRRAAPRPGGVHRP